MATPPFKPKPPTTLIGTIPATVPVADQKSLAAKVTEIHEAVQLNASQVQPNQPPGKPFDFSKVHLGIMIPCYGGQMTSATSSSLMGFMNLAARVGLTWSLEHMVNESLVQRARNGLCAKLMSNPAITHMLFIDADIGFDPESIIKLIVYDKDIISGAYPKKALPIAYNVNLERQTKVQGPLYTAYTVATGFLMFKRQVYQALLDAYPDERYVDDVGLGHQYEPWLANIFAVYVDQDKNSQAYKHLLSEDWAFCIRAKKLGYDLWVDSTIKLDHHGAYCFRGNTDLLQIKPKP
jgi:hypothetical protein